MPSNAKANYASVMERCRAYDQNDSERCRKQVAKNTLNCVRLLTAAIAAHKLFKDVDGNFALLL